MDDRTEDCAKSILYHMDEIWHWCKLSSTMKSSTRMNLHNIYVCVCVCVCVMTCQHEIWTMWIRFANNVDATYIHTPWMKLCWWDNFFYIYYGMQSNGWELFFYMDEIEPHEWQSPMDENWPSMTLKKTQ
jgi:hypothetical protein